MWVRMMFVLGYINDVKSGNQKLKFIGLMMMNMMIVRVRQRDHIGRTLCQHKMFGVQQRKENNWDISTLELGHNHH